MLADAEPGPVVVSGDSAGGGLALIIAQGEPCLAGCMLVSPWLDLTADWSADPELARRDVILTPAWLEACVEAYAREADRAQPTISPLYGALEGLPPLLIQCGTDDLVAPDAERLAVRARAAGVDVTSTRWPRLWHNFPLQPDLLAAADAAVTQSASFIAQVCATTLSQPAERQAPWRVDSRDARDEHAIAGIAAVSDGPALSRERGPDGHDNASRGLPESRRAVGDHRA